MCNASKTLCKRSLFSLQAYETADASLDLKCGHPETHSENTCSKLPKNADRLSKCPKYKRDYNNVNGYCSRSDCQETKAREQAKKAQKEAAKKAHQDAKRLEEECRSSSGSSDSKAKTLKLSGYKMTSRGYVRSRKKSTSRDTVFEYDVDPEIEQVAGDSGSNRNNASTSGLSTAATEVTDADLSREDRAAKIVGLKPVDNEADIRKVQFAHVPDTKEPASTSTNEVPIEEVLANAVPRNEVPRNEVPRNEVPRNEVPRNEVPEVKGDLEGEDEPGSEYDDDKDAGKSTDVEYDSNGRVLEPGHTRLPTDIEIRRLQDQVRETN